MGMRARYTCTDMQSMYAVKRNFKGNSSMTLRKKTLSIVSLILIALLVVLYVSSTTIVMGGFARVEDENARKNVQRALDAYADELAKLNITTNDWASWDATY